MKRDYYKIILIILVFSIVCVFSGCQKVEDILENNTNSEQTTGGTEKTGQENKDNNEPTVSASGETLSFVDVLGNKYQTTIIDSVPKHTYDFSVLNNKSDFYSYTDPTTGNKAKLGIDVSKYQGSVDWDKVKKAGIEFVIIRLGFRGYGEEGTLNLDEKYEEYIKGATDSGLQVGVYFFSQAITDDEAVKEAEYVLDNISKYNVTGPVVFDTEEMKDVEDARTVGVSGEQFTSCCVSFCDKIKAAGYTPMIYFNMKWQAFTLDIIKLVDYEKWYADYEPLPQSPYEFSIWQYTEEGKVDGVEGNVDINLWF